MPPTPAVWILIFLAAAALLGVRARAPGVVLLGAAYLLALVAGVLDWRGVIPIVLLIVAGYAARPGRPRGARVAGHVLFIALAFGLAFHLLPGFDNPRVIGPAPLTPDAVPFTMYLNLDKPLAGFWILLFWPHVRRHEGTWGWLRGLSIGLATAIVCLGLALALGAVAFAPKWPAEGWLWAINNLLLVCLTEEAIFRGYIQEELMRRLAGRGYGTPLAIGVAGALFGLAHLAGGWEYVLVAGLAGVGYGIAYLYGGLRGSVLAHFGLNLLHFSLFTYPMLAN